METLKPLSTGEQMYKLFSQGKNLSEVFENAKEEDVREMVSTIFQNIENSKSSDEKSSEEQRLISIISELVEFFQENNKG